MYTAKSASNQDIQIMCDPGATLSVLNTRALAKVGALQFNSTTMLKGLANKQIGPADVQQFNLLNSFDSKWKTSPVEAAVIPEITSLKAEDLTDSIEKVLDCLKKKKPELMEKYKHLLKLEHFQTA